MTKPFVHLHVHSTFSLLDGISRREDLIKKANEYGMPALAMTEHGNLFNAISFYKQCTEANVQPIIGMEAYIAPDSRTGRDYAKKDEAVEDAKNGDLSMSAYHLTILSKNREGYDNLKTLSSLAYREGFYRKPRIDDEILSRYKGGLIVLSGCLASKISRLIVAGNKAKALEEVNKMRSTFGEDFYLEVMHHNIDEEHVVREALIDFGNNYGIPLVMTGDSHFTEHGDEYAHEIALAIGTGKTINSEDRWKFNGDGYWFKNSDEMYKVADDANIPEHALAATLDITKKIDDYGFQLVSKTKKSIIPLYRDENGNALDNDSCHLMLHILANNGLVLRGLSGSKVYQDRLDFELDMIKRKDFSSYFLIIADIIENAMRKKGILTPIGRGSSMGSLVCYCLNITGLDPLQHKLPFERFINEGRKDLPDIDTDISQARRKEVIEYIVNKYGKDKVAQIVTFQSMSAKAVVDNTGRALGIPSSVRRALGKILGDLTKDDKLDDVLNDNKAAKETMLKTPGWIEVSKRLEGNNRNLGAHAAGIVISNEPIDKYVPLLKDSADGYLVTQYDMKDLSELGLLKLDMLGLKTIDLIQQTIDLVKKRHNVTLDFQNIPLDDAATYATVADGKFVSVFQYDSPQFRIVAKSLKPDRFEHLVALNALYRPGPMLPGSGTNGKTMMENYVDRRHGREEVVVWHPNLKEVFDDTFGLCIFQEQVMKLSQILGNFTDEEADEYRSAIGKKDAVKFKAVQEKLLAKGVGNGYSKEFMEDTIKKLAGSARYNWNRGHAAAYSYLSYITAYLETHFSTEYYTTLLNLNLDDTDELKILLSSILQKGIKLTTPHINNSQALFNADDNNIYMGLYSIRQVGEAAVSAILEDRSKFGPYNDYLDFCIRMSKYVRVNKLVKENIVKSGAFDWDTSMSKKDMVINTELIQSMCKKFEGKISRSETRELILNKLLLGAGDFSKAEKLDLEKAVLNFYISSHPVMEYQPLFNLFHNTTFIIPSQINDTMVGSRVVLIGVVEQKTMKTTKNGDPYMSLRIGDQVGTQQVNIWNPLATKANSVLLDNQLALLTGIIKEDKFRPGENQINVSSVMPISCINGIPINGFYAPDMPAVNRVLTTINATASAISDSILHHGHVVMLKDISFIKPEHYKPLKSCGRINYQLAI